MDNENLVTVYESQGAFAEVEALELKTLLESEGMTVVLVGDTVLPNLPMILRVGEEDATRAREIIAQARAAGPRAAEEAERSTES